MDSQSFIKKCISDIESKISGYPDLGDYEIYCWQQTWPTTAKGASIYGQKVKTKSMSCAVVFDEISFIYHDNFAFSCKTDENLKICLKERIIPALTDVPSLDIQLLQYRKYPFEEIVLKENPLLKELNISNKEVEKKDVSENKKVASIVIRVNHKKAKEEFEKYKKENSDKKSSDITYEKWLERQKWLSLKERIDKF